MYLLKDRKKLTRKRLRLKEITLTIITHKIEPSNWEKRYLVILKKGENSIMCTLCIYCLVNIASKYKRQSFAMNVHSVNYFVIGHNLVFHINTLWNINFYCPLDTVTVNNYYVVLCSAPISPRHARE